MSISNDQIKTWLSAAGSISFAIPEAGPIIGGLFMAAGALIPPDQQSQFDQWISDLSNQFTKDQLAAQQLVSVYFKDEFDTEWSHQDWSDICSNGDQFLEPTTSGDTLQAQVRGMIGDVLGRGISVKVDHDTFDDIRGQAWPFLYVTCGAMLRLGGAYILAQWNQQKTKYPTTMQTPAACLVTDMAAKFSGLAMWYYNICLVRRLRKIYVQFVQGQYGAPDSWIAIDEGIPGTSGQSQTFDNSDDAKAAVVGMRANVMADLAGIFASSTGQVSAWGTVCGADNWLTLKQNWWGNYSLYVNSWANDSDAPVCAVPEPPVFVCWTNDKSSTKHISDNLWSASSTCLYCYTNVVNGVESAASPIAVVQGSSEYVGIELTIPADLSQLSTSRNVYKSVISADLDDSNSQADMPVDAKLVGTVDGWDQQTFYDSVGFDAK